jgi:hypothetical protein
MGEFMELDEIAFIVNKDIADGGSVQIIGKKAYDILKNNVVRKDEEFAHYIFKMDNNFDCNKIGSFEINDIPEKNKLNVRAIDFNNTKFNHVSFQFDETRKIRFNKNEKSPVNCNTKVIIENGAYNTNDKTQIITETPTTITAENGELTFSPELQTEGAKPRRKRNKASMKKYKKRKSSTGKKKKIPRRRSRKLRRK